MSDPFYSLDLVINNLKKQGEKEPLIKLICERILLNAEDGVCYQNLKAMDEHNRLNKWIYHLWKNDYDWLASQSKWFRENFVDENYGTFVVQRRKPCYCSNRKCFLVYLKDIYSCPFIPIDDEQGHIYEVSKRPKRKKSDPVYKQYHDDFFDDPNNLLAQDIDRFIAEEEMESRLDNIVDLDEYREDDNESEYQFGS